MIHLVRAALVTAVLIALSSAQAKAFDHHHADWNSILKQAVEWSGPISTVDYKSLKSDSKKLDVYLDRLSQVQVGDFDQWTKNQQLAFLINAYNAWTIKLILDNYPLRSIKDIGGLFSSPWKRKFVKLFGAETSLDWIEHDKIRPGYKEPRIHFALVCAAKGCPGLRAEAFTAEKLGEQLENSTRRFLQDTSRNRFDPVKGELALSSIFKWYKNDFVEAKGSLQAFVLPFMTVESGQPVTEKSKMPVKFLDYDWGLNDK